MPTYTPWTWSAPHHRHYSYLLADDGTTVLDTLWSGHHHPANPAAAAPQQPPAAIVPASVTASTSTSRQSQTTSNSQRVDSLTTQSSPPYGHYPHTRRNDDDDENDARVDSPNRPRTQPLQSYRPNPPFPNNSTALPPSTSYALSPPTHLPTPQPSNTHHPSLAPHQPQRLTIETLPPDVQADINYNTRRFIRTGPDRNDAEQLDARYRRVITLHHAIFFVPGRVFKMLWTEPAGQVNPGRTRNSTHFSTTWCGEQAFSEIRRFVVVRNKGTFSQCIPVQTYKGRGATKPGLVMHDHGVIHTSLDAPNLMPGENLTKYSIRVEPTGAEVLEAQSRVNYGKAYAVEHNVKVLDIGMVVDGHRYLIESYFDSAMRGQ